MAWFSAAVASLLLCSSLQVSLRLDPDQAQFFRGDSVSLSCEHSSGNWTVIRNTSRGNRTQCGDKWGRWKDSMCKITMLFPQMDIGWYWCESEEGQTSDYVHINVTNKSRPQTSARPPPSSVFPSPFPSLSSPAPSPSSSPFLVLLVCSITGLVLLVLLFLLVLLVKQYRGSRTAWGLGGGGAQDVTYSNVLYHQHHHGGQPITDSQETGHSTVYSTVNNQEDVCYSTDIKSHQTSGPEVVYSLLWK